MRHYEIVVILNPECDRESVRGSEGGFNNLVEKYRSIVCSKGGKVHRFEDWQRPRSYPRYYMIKASKKYHYFLMNFECGTEELDELKKRLNYNDHTIRYLLTKQKKAKTEPSAMYTARKNQATQRERRSFSSDNQAPAVEAVAKQGGE